MFLILSLFLAHCYSTLFTFGRYARSEDVGAIRPDGTTEGVKSSGRTSTNAWCQHECYEDAHAQAVMERLSNLTGINETNSEYLQLLRYDVGQKYTRHHGAFLSLCCGSNFLALVLIDSGCFHVFNFSDYIPLERRRQQGPRILTVYLYLNDVEAGGGTNFPELDITCMPKRGRALLWPSVMNDAPLAMDSRTDHQALPVEAGIKYGANAWYVQN